jgi:hypothetical protein
MEAEGRVVIQGEKFQARAAKVTFNEAKDQIILEGGESGLASLYKQAGKGNKYQEVKGKKITYLRGTGDVAVDGGDVIRGD